MSTTLTVSSATGTYGTPTTVTGTLVNNYTNTPVAGETVTLKLNGTQSCTGTTNASGVATCTITPSEPGGTYTLSGSFGGDTKTVPTLLPSTGSEHVRRHQGAHDRDLHREHVHHEWKLPGPFGHAHHQRVAAARSDRHLHRRVGELGQRCSGTTNSAGKVSCSICTFNQSASPLPVTVTYGGNGYYSGSSSSQSITVNTPTSLSVSAVTGATGQPTTVTGTLTNQVTGQGITGQTVTLTLNGTQSCTATTGYNGKASCSITPTESSGTYPVTGSFAGEHRDVAAAAPQHGAQQLRGHGGAHEA